MVVNFVKYVRDLAPAWGRRQYGSALFGALAATFPSHAAEAMWRIVRLRWLLSDDSTADNVDAEARFRGLALYQYQGGESVTPGAKATLESRREYVRSAMTLWAGDDVGGLMASLKLALSQILGTTVFQIDVVTESNSSASYVAKTDETIFPNGGYLLVCHVGLGTDVGYNATTLPRVLPFVLGSGIRQGLSYRLKQAVSAFSPAESRCRGIYIVPRGRFPLGTLWYVKAEIARYGADDVANTWKAEAPNEQFNGSGTPFVFNIFSATASDKWLDCSGGDQPTETISSYARIGSPFALLVHLDRLFADGTLNAFVQLGNNVDGLKCYIDTDNALKVYLKNSSLWGTATYEYPDAVIADGAEHTFILTIEGENTIKAYVDGVEQTASVTGADDVTMALAPGIRADEYDGDVYSAADGGVNYGIVKLGSVSAGEAPNCRYRRFAYGFKSVSANLAREVHRLCVTNEPRQGGQAYPRVINPDYIARDWEHYWKALVDIEGHARSEDFLIWLNASPGIETLAQHAFEANFSTGRSVFYRGGQEEAVSLTGGTVALESGAAYLQTLTGTASDSSSQVKDAFDYVGNPIVGTSDLLFSVEWYGFVPNSLKSTPDQLAVQWVEDATGDPGFRLLLGYDSGVKASLQVHDGSTLQTGTIATSVEAGLVHILVTVFRIGASSPSIQLYLNGELQGAFSTSVNPSTSGDHTLSIGDGDVRTVFARIHPTVLVGDLVTDLHNRVTKNLLDRGFGYLLPVHSGAEETP